MVSVGGASFIFQPTDLSDRYRDLDISQLMRWRCRGCHSGGMSSWRKPWSSLAIVLALGAVVEGMGKQRLHALRSVMDPFK